MFTALDMNIKRGVPLEPFMTDRKIPIYEREDVVDNPKKDEGLRSAEESREKLFESMKYEINRLHTFLGKWTYSHIKPEDLAQMGFFYLQTHDKVQCAFCRGIISDWSVGDKPLIEHSKHFPLCPFLLGRDVGNIPIAGPQKLNSFPAVARSRPCYKPAFPAYFDSAKRLQTFKGWPLTTISPQKLAEAGFYYTDIADIVTCFFCGGSLGNWDAEDNPVTEHEMFFPDCTFLKISKTRSPSCAVQSPISDAANHIAVSPACLNGTFGGESSRSTEVSMDSILKSELVEKASQIFAEPLVKEVVLKRYNDTKAEFASLQELCEELLQTTTEDNVNLNKTQSNVQVQEIKSPDRARKDILLCKICMDNELNVVFLPCGHLISCEKCAKEVTVCPLCRKHITNTVRTYMS